MGRILLQSTYHVSIIRGYHQRLHLSFMKIQPFLVLVLVRIKDHHFIKRILTQKASVYPGFFLMSEVTV